MRWLNIIIISKTAQINKLKDCHKRAQASDAKNIVTSTERKHKARG